MPLKTSGTAQRPFRGDVCSSEPNDLRFWDTYATLAGGKCKCKEKMILAGIAGWSDSKSQTMIHVKNAETSDYELLATLGRRAFYEAFGAFNDPDDMQAYLDLAFDKERIREQLEDQANTFFIATINEQPAGYAKLKRGSTVPELGDDRVIQLERIYALRDFLGKRIGKALMERCVTVAKGEGYTRMWLSVWQPNHRAITFYEKWGFEKIGIKQFVIGKEVNDDFLMALKLG